LFLTARRRRLRISDLLSAYHTHSLIDAPRHSTPSPAYQSIASFTISTASAHIHIRQAFSNRSQHTIYPTSTATVVRKPGARDKTCTWTSTHFDSTSLKRQTTRDTILTHKSTTLLSILRPSLPTQIWNSDVSLVVKSPITTTKPSSEYLRALQLLVNSRNTHTGSRQKQTYTFLDGIHITNAALLPSCFSEATASIFSHKSPHTQPPWQGSGIPPSGNASPPPSTATKSTESKRRRNQRTSIVNHFPPFHPLSLFPSSNSASNFWGKKQKRMARTRNLQNPASAVGVSDFLALHFHFSPRRHPRGSVVDKIGHVG
jgi:hypothetical protein